MRARLFVLAGRDAGRSFDLEAEAILGREIGCAVRLADRSISRRHARLSWNGAAWEVEDLGSRNGLVVGSERVPRVVLGDPGEFQLGEVSLRLRTLSGLAAEPGHEPEPGADDVEEEIFLEDDATRAVTRVPAQGPPAPSAHANAPRLSPSPHNLLTGDLAQRPLWLRATLTLLLLAAGAGLAYLAFEGVRSLR